MFDEIVTSIKNLFGGGAKRTKKNYKKKKGSKNLNRSQKSKRARSKVRKKKGNKQKGGK